MTQRQGEKTRQIAETLRGRLRNNPGRYGDIDVRYDHGDSTDVDVCQPTSYMGRRYGADATLSGVDIVLLKKGNVFVVVEVEESSVRPKIILGDIFGTILARRIHVQGRSYPIHDATMIVALTVSRRGQQVRKYSRLERLLTKFVSDLRSSPVRRSIRKVRIIVSDVSDLVRRVERLVRLEAGKSVKKIGRGPLTKRPQPASGAGAAG
ncbi:MAG: hypothetical protein LAP85_24325 [Acidobacteriia bacterium]|nr:hypothetical protein [Terriglobia bacterium]